VAQIKPTLATVAVTSLLLTIGAGDVAAQASTQRAPAGQLIVALLTNHSARDRPSATSRSVALVSDIRPITAERTMLPVLSQTTTKRGQTWLRVRLPGRALGEHSPTQTGWISASKTQLFITPWRIYVDLNARQVTVDHNGRAVQRFPAIVGKPSTPTPTGDYFVEENVHLGAGGVGGPFALATSDRSNVLQEFDGGPGQIALHGLDNVGGQLGTAESHGCIRMADSAITWLAARIGPGTPVTIR
jgi:lipoprotein-anchoring transpeptidase ErfK/SrfK